MEVCTFLFKKCEHEADGIVGEKRCSLPSERGAVVQGYSARKSDETLTLLRDEARTLVL